MTPPVSRKVRIVRALQRGMLPLAPRDVRRRYRAEMIATFEAASADAGARGTGALCRLFIREAMDLLWRAARIARPACRSRRPSRADHAVRRTGIGMDGTFQLASGAALLETSAGISGRVSADAGFWRGRHDGRVFARRHGADQAAAVSGRGSAGYRLRVQSGGARADEPRRSGAARGLAPAEPQLRGARRPAIPRTSPTRAARARAPRRPRASRRGSSTVFGAPPIAGRTFTDEEERRTVRAPR